MPFIPIDRRPSGFPHVSEFDQVMPDENRAALESEYRQRFGKEPPAAQRGFIPLANAEGDKAQSGFVPLESADAEGPSTMQRAAMAAEPYVTPALKTVQAVATGYPVAETAANLATMGVSLPVAGIAGMGAAASRALGLTDADPADVVHEVGNALTYQPKTELGQHLTRSATYPFELLAKGGAAAGDKVLDVTGSPVAATAIDTAINALPMAIAPAWKAGKTTAAHGLLNHHPRPSPEILQKLLRISPDEASAYFETWQAARAAKTGGQNAASVSPVPGGIQHLDAPAAALHEPVQPRLEALRREGDQGLPALDGELQQLPDGRWVEAAPEALAGAAGREWGLRADELPVAGTEVPGRQSALLPQGDLARGEFEHRGNRAPGSDLPEHVPASPAETGNGRGFSAVMPDDAPRRTDAIDLQRTDAEPGGMGSGGWDQSGNPAGAPVPLRDRTRASPDQGGSANESLTRAERILNEHGSIAGWVDYYNKHVRDGYMIESFSRNQDGSHSLRVSNGREARTVTIPADRLREHLNVLRDPARVAELEARNQGDVVLGRNVRELDDSTLARWRDMVSLSDPARLKLEREAARRQGQATQATAASLVEKQEAQPLSMQIDQAAHEAATSPLNDKPQPTPAQIDAGTYAKGHLDLHGLKISIENPKGSTRRGTDASGRPWETEMKSHYGYIKRTLAKDGDHVDVFIGGRPESTRAFVIDQIDPKTGKYDEPKVILGALDETEARAIYQANYEPGWKGLGAITPMEMDAFKGWVNSEASKKPVGLPRIVGKAVTEFDDAALARIAESRSYSDVARTKAQTELERRTASADSTDEAVRARVGETSSPQDMAAGVQNGTWNPGANYAPFADQMRAPEAKAKTVADLPDPLRREQIVGDLAKALDTTIYEGRVKGKRRLGFFRPGVNEVRIKNAADIEVAAHEVAHLIDHRVPEISSAWRSDKALREELKSVSYDQKSVKEGFAEGVRLFLTQPDVLEARAPKVHAWLESFTQDHKYGPALRKAQDQMTSWFGQDALNRARSKIGSDKPLAEYFDGFWDKFRQSTVDDLHGIYRMERDQTGKINPNGPYESARLSRASASIADGAIRFGYPVKNRDGSFSWKGRGLEDILKPVAESMDDALLYFVGRSSAELMAQKREHLFTRGEIDGMLNLRTPEREKAFQDYQEWNRGILDFAEAQGIINPESRRLWQRTQYLPFHRVEQPGGIKGKPGEWSGIQALTGGTTNIKDVLGNMVGNAAMLLDKAVKNEARLKVARLSQMEGGGKFMVKIDTESRPVKISGDQVLEAMLKKYGIAIDGDAPAFFEFLMKGQPPAGKNVVAVLQKGKPVWFEVGDPLLYRALSAIDRPVQSEVVRWLGLPKRIGQASITAVPDFWLANIARDTIMGSVMSRSGFRPILDSLDGMRMRMTQDPIYKEWVANGGGLSSIYLDEGHFRAKLEKFYGRQGIDYRTVLDSPSKLLNMIETLGDAFESSTRLGEYKRSVARGDNPRHAAYLARDVSTDFAMKGDSKALGFMYDTVMFLRPALVSWDRLYRGLAHDPNKGAIAAKAGTIALMSAGLYLLNRDDPRYADLADWDRDSNWHFFVGDQHFRYPKIWEIGAMASGAERSVEKIMAGDPMGLGKDFARIIANTFSLNLVPQIIAPLAEQATNRNAFTKAPIETPGMENVQPFLRSKPSTSETMKAAGMATRNLPEALQVNPARAEALLRGYFNTWALYGLMLSDQALFGDKLPERRADQMPVIRRFYTNDPAQHTKYETAFYDLLQESKRLRGTMKELDDMGLRTFADDKETSPLAGEAKPMERAAKNLGIINKDAEQVRRSDANPAEKRKKLDTLTVERNALLKAAVTESKAAQKEREK
ncbi:MAG: hypothetical protein M0P95_13845 [Sulfuritalea sp.]|nr:hypothetical protein [Sulfuritalea sp.]